ncbi:MAG: acyl-CoA dehydrogenase, partial [Gemmatimonadales bacterium]|nr:acyl-CoA dehydrogenase [Gemmatimonadales bacterium]
MKVLKALAALGLVLAPAAQAQFNPYATTSSDIMTITTFNPLRPAGSHVAMLASPGSPMLDIWCVDFQNSIRSPNAVNFTRFDASAADFNARTHFGFANLDNYKKAAWLPKIAEGSAVTALAVDESSHHAPERVALKAEKTGDGYALTGKKTFVIDGDAADLLIVAARTSGKPGETAGITMFLVDPNAAGVTRKHLALADSRGAAEITFDGAAGEVLGAVDKGWDVLEPVLDRARIGLAAEMLGSAMQAFEITLEYLKTRTQFGQLIGAFQSLQHRAAKMFTDLETTRSCIEAALEQLDSGAADNRAAASLAKGK